MRINYKDGEAIDKLADYIADKFDKVDRELVFVCIGTDRSTGDSLGPLIGTELDINYLYVYGTLDKPVHAQNLEETLKEVKERFDNPFIVAIDAALGKYDQIGDIIVRDGPSKPGAALNKNLPEVGDLSITGIVNVGGFMELQVLQGTRLSVTMTMADVIASALNQW